MPGLCGTRGGGEDDCGRAACGRRAILEEDQAGPGGKMTNPTVRLPESGLNLNRSTQLNLLWEPGTKL